MSIKAWFPTFIYYEALSKSGGNRFNDELLKECHQIRDFDDEGRKWSEKNYPGGYTSYASMAQLHRFSSTFGELERRINKHVKAFISHLEMDLRKRRFSMSDCWVNIMPRSGGPQPPPPPAFIHQRNVLRQRAGRMLQHQIRRPAPQ